MTRVLFPEALRQENFSEELKEDHLSGVYRKGQTKHVMKSGNKERTITCRALWVMVELEFVLWSMEECVWQTVVPQTFVE